jgi:hypothetical protein
VTKAYKIIPPNRLIELETAELEARILVLPVAVGETVYEVCNCKCGAHYAVDCQGRKNKKAEANKKAIYVTEVRRRGNSVYCKKIFARPFDPAKHLKQLEKTVFLTKADAEKAIQKGIQRVE